MSDSCIAAFVKRYAPTAGAQIWNAFESGWKARAEVEASTVTEEKALEVSDKIVTDWLAEVGSDKHGLEWDDLADLKVRIGKALRGEP